MSQGISIKIHGTIGPNFSIYAVQLDGGRAPNEPKIGPGTLLCAGQRFGGGPYKSLPLKPQVPLILTTQSWGGFQLGTSAFNLVLH
jgi:hypothetical protein